jgi:superfamily I DNA/RNA helicase
MSNEIKYNIPWIEKYRPLKLEDVIADENILTEMNNIIKNKNIPNMIFTGTPGIGKTTTILCRIKYMIEFYKVNPKKILLTTFNTDASMILKSRLKSLLKKDPEVRIGTFDSISAHFYFKYFKSDGYVGVNEYSSLLLTYLNSPDGKKILDLSDKEFEKDVEVIKTMSEDEKRFSFLSSGFIYKKERNSSDLLLKKLIENAHLCNYLEYHSNAT